MSKDNLEKNKSWIPVQQINGCFSAGYSIFWLMNDFFLHASACFEAIFVAPVKRSYR